MTPAEIDAQRFRDAAYVILQRHPWRSKEATAEVARALAEAVAQERVERDRMWCRALTTEDPETVERVTSVFNSLRARAEGGAK
jgi:hypothetical protein